MMVPRGWCTSQPPWRIRIRQEKRSSTPVATLAAPVALLALRGHAMAYNIGAVTVGAVKHLCDHRGSLSYGWFGSAQTPIKNSRSTDLKHLRLLLYDDRCIFSFSVVAQSLVN
jgi:hypothetical protein